MTMHSKIVCIAVDAGDKDLILRWAAEGVLPTFERLLREASWGTTKNPPGLFVGAVWPSFATGTSPAQHGRYSPKQLMSGTYEFERLPLTDIKEPLFWEILSRAGKRVAVIDVPRTKLARGLNGIQIFNWLSHDPEPEGFVTWPDGLAGEIEQKYGLNALSRCDGTRTTAEEYESLRAILLDRVLRKGNLSLDLLREGGWDLFLTVFTESHCAGHQFWKIHDNRHFKHDPALARSLGDPLRDVYRQIDGQIGRILKEVSPETTVFVLASHGMGPHYDGTAVLGETLMRLEARYDPWMRFRKQRSRFGHRLCFKVPNNTGCGAVRINLAGREPHGRVRPGAEYEKLRDRLVRDLGEVVNLETKLPAVLKISKVEELYPGQDTSHLPDLLIDWDRRSPIRSVYSPKVGKVEGEYRGCRTGDHKPDGLFFAKGPGISAGRLEEPISVMDLAPTIVELLDTAMPTAQGNSLLPKLILSHVP